MFYFPDGNVIKEKARNLQPARMQIIMASKDVLTRNVVWCRRDV